MWQISYLGGGTLSLLRAWFVTEDTVQQEVCHKRAVVFHRHPYDMVELAFVQSDRLGACARLGEDVVSLIIVNRLIISVSMPGEDRIGSLTQQRHELLPVFQRFELPPERLVQENQCPSNITVGFDDLAKILKLLIADMAGSGIFGIQAEKQNIAVDEMIVA